MTAPRSVLIVGESLAGTTAARHLRTLGHTGPVTIIGAEEEGAYSRPPLSKAVLKDRPPTTPWGCPSTASTSASSARQPSRPSLGAALSRPPTAGRSATTH
ncbi:NAD(P)/FAD-dependent oxidoreductase [Streptomyces justiciae]|uniref:NAD(P)/FAD-dependent oxidoreductase n=1 Tax=Streptomyces justiciae TaxID=2780140 RepID=UPI001D153008|nr:NAD(P)/FAD-dependent oxidoreductase [Streptomyces justiciae]MCW8382502.1 NAD(P)/FAD-dependent oxidoreductase [Streptomyces justiciae]